MRKTTDSLTDGAHTLAQPEATERLMQEVSADAATQTGFALTSETLRLGASTAEDALGRIGSPEDAPLASPQQTWAWSTLQTPASPTWMPLDAASSAAIAPPAFAAGPGQRMSTQDVVVQAVPSILVDDVIVGEGDGYVDLVVRLSAPSASTVTVNYTTVDYTAFDGGSDVNSAAGTLSFAAGETTKTVRVTVLNGSIDESLERLLFKLSAPSNATLDKDGQAWITIVDNDDVRTTPEIYVRDVVVDEAAGTATFAVTLGNYVGQSSSGIVSVDYTTANGSATAGSDYTATSGTLTFNPGESVKLVTVNITNDVATEGSELFKLLLSNVSGATIAVPSATATIGASDSATVSQPKIQVADVIVGERDSYVDVVVTLSAPSTNTVTVNYATADYTAFDSGSDVESLSGTIYFAPGETTQVVRIDVVNGSSQEALERLLFKLSAPSNATLDKDGQAWITIVDNDNEQTTPEIYVRDVVVDEAAGTATFAVTLGNYIGQSSSGIITVDYTTANGTATAGSDYTATSGTLTFNPGESVKLVTVNITNDVATEGSELFKLLLSNVAGATIAVPSASATIGASDAANVAQPKIQVADVIVGENAGYVDVVVTLSAPSANTVTVSYATADYTAFDSGSDVESLSGTIYFAPGETTQVVRIDVVNGSSQEALERLLFKLSAPSNATLDKDGQAWITIVDNDNEQTTPEIYVRDVVVDEAAGTATFAVTLGNYIGQSSSGIITVDYTTANGTATAGSDYTATSGTLTFNPGESVKLVTVNITNDVATEGSELFKLLLSNVAGATIAVPSASATIGASDAANVAQPKIQVADVIVGENAGYVDVVVTLSAPSANTVTVSYATADYTAFDSGSDVESLSGTIYFAPGETTQVVRIDVVNSSSDEALERLLFKLSAPSNATLDQDGQAWITIVDNDNEQTTPEIYVRDVVVDEAAGTATFAVTLGNYIGQSSTGIITVDYTTANGTATAGSDYTATSGTLTFNPGESVKLVTVNITNDVATEGSELFKLLLSNVAGAVITTPSASASIGANDAAAVAQPKIRVGDVVVSENAGYVDLVISLSAPSSNTVSVNYSTADWTAFDSGSDAESLSGLVSFAPGQTTQVVRIDITNSSSSEALESLRFVLSTPVNAVLEGDGIAEIQIIDNDTVVNNPEAFVSDVIVDEKAGTATFTVTLGRSGGLSAEATAQINYSTANGTATAGSDYVAQSGTLYFGAGESVKTVVVQLTDDAASEGREYFHLDLSNPLTALIGDGRGTASIGASDAAVAATPVITALDRVVVEDRGYVDVTLKLSAPSNSLVSVRYTSASGSATSGDYQGTVSGTAYFQPGETTTTVRIELVNSSSIEAIESFVLNLSSPSNATLGNTAATIFIVDDDDSLITLLEGDDSDNSYTVLSASDYIVESVDGGTDRVNSAISYTLSPNVENLTLTGSAAINGTGNESANTLNGNSAANVLTGLGGDDLYIVGSGDTVVEGAGGGTDTVQAAISWSLAANVEKLVLTGSGSVNGTGNSLNNTLTGNSGANVLNGGTGADTLIGGAGNDSYTVDSTADVVTETSTVPTEVDTVNSSVSWTLGANLEKLTLTGTASVNGTGNALNNTLTGNSGANALNGGTGVDTLIGGTGNDTYTVDGSTDVVTETSTLSSEIDTINSSVSWTLGSNLERLTLTGTAAINGTGNSLDNTLTGNSAANNLNGGAGADSLIGGSGADTLTGGTGNDSYTVDSSADVVSETTTTVTEIDSVISSVTWTLGSNLEHLSLSGSAAINGTGNTLNNALTGNSAGNVLSAGDGQDSLNGGAGADSMYGGNGSDTYTVDNTADVVSDSGTSPADIDTVNSSVSWTLGANVERLTLTGSSNLNGTGNSLANTLTGNAGANALNGGTGADTLIGGAGNDVYTVDNALDVVSELSTVVGELDTVNSSISWTLGANLEKLVLTGASAINGTGNSLNNSLSGNSAANVLNGGTGADSLYGGTGNDTYVVDNVGDVASESSTLASEIDTVNSSISWTLGSNLERLTLTGTAAINGTGNSLANTLIGNSAANILSGGLGADTLTGGAGSDIFALSSSLTSDLITDFTSGSDDIRISQLGIRIGDGDTVVDGAVSVAGPGGFSSSAELVVVTGNIAGSITTSSAAAAIGSATSAYAVNSTRLFAVDNGSSSALYLFTSVDGNATVSASELKLLASLQATPSISTGDLIFSP